MTEMKEKIYPTLPTIREAPTAPDIELHDIRNDEGHSYRLKVILDIQKFLKKKLINETLSVKNIFV